MTITISAVILAGGEGKRMGGVDKGLQLWQRRPLVEHILQRLQPQVEQISINANRNQDQYAQLGVPVFADHLTGFLGALSGMLTSLQRATTDFVLFVPCDCPMLPLNLLAKLKSAVSFSKVSIAYAQDGEREHPTFCLISTALQQDLADYLAQGERKMLKFMQQHHAIAVDFSHEKACFMNVNYRHQLTDAHPHDNPQNK